MTEVGRRFAEAIAGRNEDALRALLADDVDFRGLTPRKFWEATSPDEVAEVVFGNWFEEQDRIDAVTVLDEGDDVGDTHRVAYRFDLTTPDGPRVVEQQAYYRDRDDRLVYVRVVCSGFRPRT